ncbi:MAG: PorT family protein [Muribaculaceae bacterium]|nr:PorT family protein [Muribaculaceae bacterium]
MKLQKAMVVAAAIMIGVGGSRAATTYLFDNPENRTYLGVRVGLDISSAANGGGYYSNMAGFSAGAVYNIPLWRNLYFEPGLSVFYNPFGTNSWSSYQVSVPVIENGAPVIGADGNPVTMESEVRYQIDGSIRNFGFRMPLIVGYHFDFTEDVKVHVYTGPQLNLSLLARYHRESVAVPEAVAPAESFSLFGTNGFKHFDLQWNFGVGLSYQTYYVGLSGSWGITDMKSGTALLPRDLHRNLFSITLGYNF